MFSNEVIINSIERYYPEVLADMKKRLTELLPMPETDLERLTEIVKLYCEVKFIEPESITGRSIQQAYVANRKELLAVIMMFYQPEKLHGISKVSSKQGLITKLSEILRCSGNNLSNFIPEIIVYFKAYEYFYISVTDTYKKIKENLK